jgi:hypothetical protein
VDISELWDTIVEVVDLKSGTALAQERIPAVVLNTLPGGRAVTYGSDPDGAARVHVLQFMLQR